MVLFPFPTTGLISDWNKKVSLTPSLHKAVTVTLLLNIWYIHRSMLKIDTHEDVIILALVYSKKLFIMSMSILLNVPFLHSFSNTFLSASLCVRLFPRHYYMFKVVTSYVVNCYLTSFARPIDKQVLWGALALNKLTDLEDIQITYMKKKIILQGVSQNSL